MAMTAIWMALTAIWIAPTAIWMAPTAIWMTMAAIWKGPLLDPPLSPGEDANSRPDAIAPRSFGAVLSSSDPI